MVGPSRHADVSRRTKPHGGHFRRRRTLQAERAPAVRRFGRTVGVGSDWGARTGGCQTLGHALGSRKGHSARLPPEEGEAGFRSVLAMLAPPAWAPLRVAPGGPGVPLRRASAGSIAPSTGRPLHSPRSPCLFRLPSRPSFVSSRPRASSASPAAAPRRPGASGPSRGRSASSPRVPLSSPAARRALTGWPAGCRRLSCSAPPASGGGVAASRVGPSPSCGASQVRGLRRSGCRRQGGRALGGWCHPRPRRPASRGSARGPGRRWRSHSAWASGLSCGCRRASRRLRAGASRSCVLGARAPGGARELNCGPPLGGENGHRLYATRACGRVSL